MSSIRIILRKKAHSDGTYPLVVRVIKDRKTSIITLGHNVHLKDWNEKDQCVKKSHPNSVKINNLLSKRMAEVRDKYTELQTNNTDTSSRVIINAYKAAKEGTFFKQAELYKTQLEATGKFNRLSAESPRIERFSEFLKGIDINFSEINPGMLRRFQVYIKSTRKVTERTIVNHLVVIRTIFNLAISDKLVDPKYYPFGKAKGNIKIKFPESAKIGLSIPDIIAIENIELDKYRDHARNLWLFSFYLAGMRISDVFRLKWSDIHDGRLHYTMGKNKKTGSLEIPKKALVLLEKYIRENPKHNLVFPDLEKLNDITNDLEVQKYIKTRTKAANENFVLVLKEAKVKKKATMKYTRHTYAQIAGDKIDPRILQEQYRHTSILTTMGYQGNFIHKDTDKALNDVVNFNLVALNERGKEST